MDAKQTIIDMVSAKFELKPDDKVMLADIDLAIADALDYCNRDELVGNMPYIVSDIYVWRKNREGTEGETNRTEGGVSQAFEVGLPKHITSKLNRYRLGSVRRL